jgi:2-polyprenyl-6-methoxyphenol hydroxylase-like FAD-dependent oxidoreductase
MKILVSGASIAGPAVALSLARYGFRVTIVERALTVRTGGYPIDLRGTAIHVAEKLGFLPALREAHIDTKRLRFFDNEGQEFASINPDHLIGGIQNHDVEIPRWTLGSLLYEATRHDVEYRFNDSIAAIDQDSGGAHIAFQSGRTETFDVVIGADGIHSNARAITFGPEELFTLYLGYVFAIFTGQPLPEFDQEGAICFNENRVAAIYAVRGVNRLYNMFVLRRPAPSAAEMADIENYRRMMRDAFENDGWLVPAMLQQMEFADDLYCDVVSQVKMPTWSSGRVVLVGDAAYAPSFQTGQGSSLALVGAYILAGELASHADPTAAFASYEKIMREFVADNQSIASPNSWPLVPKSAAAVTTRRERLAALQAQAAPDERALKNRKIHNLLELPQYPEWKTS